jgi:hypothetical protein
MVASRDFTDLLCDFYRIPRDKNRHGLFADGTSFVEDLGDEATGGIYRLLNFPGHRGAFRFLDFFWLITLKTHPFALQYSLSHFVRAGVLAKFTPALNVESALPSSTISRAMWLDAPNLGLPAA